MHNAIATFADDTALLALGKDHEVATRNLQICVNQVNNWIKCWGIKLNEIKSIHSNFTNIRDQYIRISINNT